MSDSNDRTITPEELAEIVKRKMEIQIQKN